MPEFPQPTSPRTVVATKMPANTPFHFLIFMFIFDLALFSIFMLILISLYFQSFSFFVSFTLAVLS